MVNIKKWVGRVFGKKVIENKSTTTLPRLFYIRERANAIATQDIMNMINPAIEALTQFMNFAEVKEAGAELEWQDVTMLDQEEDPLLIIIGLMYYPVGAEVELPTGDKIKVTEDTAPYFRRLVRAALPLSIADKSKTDVLAYLEKVDAEEQARIELAMQDQEIDQSADFDLSKLTEEQRKNLEMFNTVKGGKTI